MFETYYNVRTYYNDNELTTYTYYYHLPTYYLPTYLLLILTAYDNVRTYYNVQTYYNVRYLL